MAIGINISVDVTAIDKSKIVEAKNGKKYLNMTAFVRNEKGQYGDNGMVTHSQTKEEREQNVRAPILGNVSVFWDDSNQFQTQQAEVNNKPAAPAYAGDDMDDTIPF